MVEIRIFLSWKIYRNTILIPQSQFKDASNDKLVDIQSVKKWTFR